AVRAQDQGDLAAVVDVVLGDVPDDEAAISPGPRAVRSRRGALELGLEVVRRPPAQTRRDVAPGLVEGGADRGGVRLGYVRVVVHAGQALQLLVPLTHPAVEPPGPRGDDVAREHAYRPEAFARRPQKLFLG